MGQKIEISSAETIGDVAIFDTDRSLSGQDGERYRSAADATASSTLPARLAVRLFDADEALRSVYVTSNVVSVERAGGWDEGALEETGTLLSEFFAFYVPST